MAEKVKIKGTSVKLKSADGLYSDVVNKKNDFPTADAKLSKFVDFDEYGPPLSPDVFKTAQVKNVDLVEQIPYWENIGNQVGDINHTSAVGKSTSVYPSKPGILKENRILPPKYHIVSMLNKSRQNTPELKENLFDSKNVFKLGHIRNPSLPSVSKVLSATMSVESKAALAKWEKEKIAMLGLDGFKKLKSDTFARGHTLHSILESYMETGKLPSAGDIPDYVSKRHLVSISQAVKLFDRPVALESAVVHPELNYHGIVDCVAMLGDTLVLVDWKTSERVKNSKAALYDNPLQVAAYMGAINSDERYSSVGNLTKGVVVVVYNSGYPAMVHEFSTKQMEKYWEKWCHRLHMYHAMI